MQEKLLRLWCHEESRVFRDRLICAEDRTWFNEALQVGLLGLLKRFNSDKKLAPLS